MTEARGYAAAVQSPFVKEAQTLFVTGGYNEINNSNKNNNNEINNNINNNNNFPNSSPKVPFK
jgi:hypothetical protein